eukprot:GEMP01145661.1.p1 GENE.GEMP01145661.1~~GEMP01145661.1.p1  ORF type:complete len:129 (-),score=21.47 GEMP01145661.1:46-408(-)
MAGITKRTLYVGGLEEQVNKDVLQAAFAPFGEIKTVEIPIDHKSGKHKGFGFVEFVEEEDTLVAIDNMHESELYGRILNVNLAREPKHKAECTRPIWADDFFYRRKLAEQGIEEIDDNDL